MAEELPNPAAPTADASKSTSPELAAILESVSSLGEELKGISERLNGFEEIITAQPEPPEVPIDPNNDPENVPPASWKALREEFRNEADRKAEEKFNAKLEEQQKESQNQQEFIAGLDKQFDEMADEAVKKGFLPAIGNDADFNDPGKVARRELFGYAAKLGSTNLVDVAENLASLHQSGQKFDVQTGKMIQEKPVNPGRFAPVGSSAARTQSNSGKIDYRSLHNTSLNALARRAMSE